VKVFLSTDIEGTAGIVDWGQVLGSGEYEMGRRLLQNEVNAAIDGALEAGATELVVNDSHWTMQNLLPAELHGRASLISGKHKPLYMMEGLDGGFDAAFMVSYHGSIGHELAILAHTYNPSAIWEVKINGIVTGGTERLAPHQPPAGQPRASRDTVAFDGLGGIVGARRQKPARPVEVRGNEELVASEQRQRHADAHPELTCGGDVVR